MSIDFATRQSASLRAERNRKGITQEQLANLAGVSKDSINKWEKGECVMSFKNAYKISSVLECDMSDLCREP